jgi:hypothetical protein
MLTLNFRVILFGDEVMALRSFGDQISLSFVMKFGIYFKLKVN